MLAIEKKLQPLQIDTKSIRPLTPLSPRLEEKNDILVDSPATVNTRPRYHLTTNRFSNKRYSTTFLHPPNDLHNNHEDMVLSSPIHDIKSNGHKRSTSADNENVTLPRNQSVPDLLSKRVSYDAKSHSKSTGDIPKKKWFQLPRITLKRQASTPQKNAQDSLKAGSVEPPEPPPQLLFNLDWSSKDSTTPLFWDNDVNSYLISTPRSSKIRRRCSGYGLEMMISNTDNSDSNSSDTTLTANDITYNEKVRLTRRLSCPDYENCLAPSLKDEDSSLQSSPLTPTDATPTSKCCSKVKHTSTGSGSKLFSNFQRSKRGGRGVLKDVHGVIPSALSSTSSVTSNSSSPSPLPSPKPHHTKDYEPLLFNVYAPNTNDIVLNFNKIKPRTQKLKRKVSPKLEQKALHLWQNQLMLALNDMKSISPKNHVISSEKKERYYLTRKFIFREFYTTEINFWNQLNYTKVMFCDPLLLAIERHSEMARPSDIDWFANLQDLMKFSYTLILRLRNAQIENNAGIVCKSAAVDPSCQTCPIDICVGSVLREMAEHMVVFLRCALDYRANKKLVDHRMHNKGYALYSEKLNLRKETRQFTFQDYLIIPIQRITRYGLLLADLEKHTEATHPDYENIRTARCIIRSLADAMNSVQKK